MEEIHPFAVIIPTIMIVGGALVTIYARKVATLNDEALKALGTKSALKALRRSTPAQFRFAGVIFAFGGLLIITLGWLPRMT